VLRGCSEKKKRAGNLRKTSEKSQEVGGGCIKGGGPRTCEATDRAKVGGEEDRIDRSYKKSKIAKKDVKMVSKIGLCSALRGKSHREGRGDNRDQAEGGKQLLTKSTLFERLYGIGYSPQLT